jgi:tetratricopeptide (TPR) repeat protein
LGRHDDAVREIKEVIRLNPENPGAYANLVGMASAANKLDVARAAHDEARKRNLDSPYLREARYMLGFLENDHAAMQEQLQWAAGKPRTEDVMLQHEADSHSYSGRVQQSRLLSRRAVESAKGADAMEAASQWELRQALAEVELGNLGIARRLTDEALRLSNGRDNRVGAALIYARADDAAKAKRLSNVLSQEFPLDTVLQNVALPSIRAAIALQQHKPLYAIEVLGVSKPYELGQSTISYIYPAYLRGEAYLRTGQPDRAAVEFRTVINNPGVVGNFVGGVLAHRQLARAQAMMGDKEAALKSYQDFLTLWKDADLDTSVYRQAKAEYAKLQ